MGVEKYGERVSDRKKRETKKKRVRKRRGSEAEACGGLWAGAAAASAYQTIGLARGDMFSSGNICGG